MSIFGSDDHPYTLDPGVIPDERSFEGEILTVLKDVNSAGQLEKELAACFYDFGTGGDTGCWGTFGVEVLPDRSGLVAPIYIDFREGKFEVDLKKSLCDNPVSTVEEIARLIATRVWG